MQMASLFTSMQQAETQTRRNGETVEEYNRRKAIAKLTKIRFMKRMEKLTKDLKENNPITHNYSIPKPTNDAVLTKISPKMSDQLTVIPNIENDIQDELNKLGISTNLRVSTNSISNQLSSNEASQVTASAYHRISPPLRTTQQLQKTTEITEEKQMKVNKSIQEQKNEQMSLSPPEQVYKESQQKIMIDSREDKEKADNQSVPALLPSQLCTEHPQKTAITHLRDQYQETPNEELKHVSAENLQKRKRKVCQSETESEITHEYKEEQMDNTEGRRRKNINRIKPAKLTHDQHNRAYPWAHAASKNMFKKTPLAKELEYILHNDIGTMLTNKMKRKICQVIELPCEVMEEINNNIECTGLTGFKCQICSKYFKHRYHIQRHVKIEMGYNIYRCTFCNYKANCNISIYKHYPSKHGLPKQWVSSLQLSDDSNTDNTDTDDTHEF